MRLNVCCHSWLLHHVLAELGVHGTLSVRIVIALFDYVSSLCGDLGLAELCNRSTLLHLSIDKLDLLLHFFQHLGQTTLLKDGLSAKEVFLGLLGLGWVINHVESTNDLVGLSDV